ncbi:MAG TPA: hypothetical protein VKX39_13575 [Bryobacteraceae bacterium]|jgi:signal transduction histidine kinase|nr:hypothetical protein [Bryobacteraceae bacterium]
MVPPAAVASADILRTMAHELRQPLSTIESIAYYLALVLPPEDEKVHQHLDRIQRLVEQSSWIVTSAQQLAEPVRISVQPVRIDRLVEEILAERSTAGDAAETEIQSGLPAVNLDPAMARALLINLLTLFRCIAKPGFPPQLTLRADDVVTLELATGAIGYKSESSLGPGATLSLESARRMVAAHGGSIDLRIDPGEGVRLRVLFAGVVLP